MIPILGAICLAGCTGNSSWQTEHTVEIAASPTTVWRILVDLERYAEWNPYSRRVDGTLQVGAIVRVEAHLGDDVQIVDNLVTEIEVERTLCWESMNWYRSLAQGVRCRHLSRLANGSTRLRHHEIMRGPLAWLIERLYRERIEEGLQVADDALRKTAEAASGESRY